MLAPSGRCLSFTLPLALHAAARNNLASACSELSSDALEEASADFLSKPGHRSGPAARSPWGSACAPCLEGIHTASAHRSKWGGPAQLSLSALPVFLISHSLACCSCLEFLLDNGADPSLRDKQGYTAVHYAAAYGNRQNLELVSKRENPLCWQEIGEGPSEGFHPALQCRRVCCRQCSVSVCPGTREMGLMSSGTRGEPLCWE